MKTRIFTICFVVLSMIGVQAFAQDCATCTPAAPCNTCATCCCKPVELFGGLKNLMACRPCVACEAPAPVVACAPAPAPAPVVACAPAAPICKPAPACVKVCKPCKPCKPCKHCKPCKAPKFCAPIAPCVPPAPVCAPAAPAAPVCAPAAPVCEPVCAPVCAPCFPKFKAAINRPFCGVHKAVNGLFVALADATAPRCCKACGVPACACDAAPVVEACGPVTPIDCGAAPAVPAPPANKIQALPASPAPKK